jgi:hypothetical protein
MQSFGTNKLELCWIQTRPGGFIRRGQCRVLLSQRSAGRRSEAAIFHSFAGYHVFARLSENRRASAVIDSKNRTVEKIRGGNDRGHEALNSKALPLGAAFICLLP